MVIPLLSTKVLPLEVSAVFAGAICAKADELAKITKAAEIAADLRNVMSVLLSDCSGGAPLAETPGGMNLSAALFQRAENSNKPNQKASAAKRDQCMNPSLSTQSAFTTKLNVRKGPALLCTAVDHACHFRSSSLVVRISYYRFNTIAGQWPLNLGTERVADHGKNLLLTILAICRRLRLP